MRFSHLCTLLPAFLLCGSTSSFAQDKPSALPTLQYDVWSGDINVPDPVALSVDNLGRVFVTQTRRRKSQDLDIRANREWIPNDVGFQSVDDKRNFYHKQLAIGGDDSQQKKHVGDLNKDGHHDWRDLTVISERIFRLVDSTGNGKADQITTFAEGFHTEVTGIAAGVLAHDANVYATIAPDVWRLADQDNDGVADTRQIIATGFGLHIAYAGHDMHGLTVGPDGKIYWSIGDKGISVKTADGKEFRYPNEGGVMRCNPDGTQFEVFAHGLRNVQEFAFDKYGNIFAVDNDADQPGERERFVNIVDGMDAGWRCHYQYRGNDYNPWTDERLWDLPGKDHAAYIVPPIDHYMDGPAGFKYNPGTALSPSYRDFFFVTNAPRGLQYAFRAEPAGDSYKMVDAHEIGSGYAIVGLAFGPDGGLYGADWDGGYPLDEKGSVVRIDVPTNQQSPHRSETQRLLAAGFEDRSVTQLIELLQHPDQRVRLGAQFSLVNKNASKALVNSLKNPPNEIAALHCIWGLGQIARRIDNPRQAVAAMQDALQSESHHVRAQAAKTLGELPTAIGTPLIALLTDKNLHVRVNAGLAIARLRPDGATEKLLSQSDSLLRSQHYLRHSIAHALAACASSDELSSQSDHPSELRRIVCVLALRKQADPAVKVFLPDPSNWVATEAARAIHDDNSIPGALRALAESLDAPSTQRPEPFVRRAINANFRLGTPDAVKRLLAFAADESQDLKTRIEAAQAVGRWTDTPVLDRVEGIYRDLPIAQRDLDRKTSTEAIAELIQSPLADLQVAAIAAARNLRLTVPTAALVSLMNSKQVPAKLRIEALQSIAASKKKAAQPHIIAAVQSNNAPLSVAAIGLTKHLPADVALRVIDGRLSNTPSLTVHQACIRALGNLGTAGSRERISQITAELTSGKLTHAVALDVVETVTTVAANESTPAGFADNISALDRFRQQESQTLKLDAPKSSKFTFSKLGGDATNGQKLFQTHLQAQCARCHRIGKRGSNIGPELTKIGKDRDHASILQSIVEPNAEIEKKYFTQSLLMDTGRIITGVIKSQNDDETILINSNGKEQTLVTDEIEAIRDKKVSLMPDMREVLTPTEVRDLVAYLSSLKP